MQLLLSHMLTAIIFLPLLGAALILLVPARWKGAVRAVGLVVALVTLALCALAWFGIEGSREFELGEIASWIPAFGIHYHVGVDGASMLLMLMIALIVPMGVLVSWNEVDERVRGFHVWLFVAEAGFMGVFAALDIFLFYVSWQVVLIALFFLVGSFGLSGRLRAAHTFLLFVMAGGMLLLVAMLAAAGVVGSFDLLDWYAIDFPFAVQRWLFLAMAVAFAIPAAVVGLHMWLADAVAEAPTAGAILIVGGLLKMGCYGFYRFAMPLFPEALAVAVPVLCILALVGIIAGALMAAVQPTLKRAVAYLAVAQTGIVLLGFSSLNVEASAGAVVVLAAQGLVSVGLLGMAGMLSGRGLTDALDGSAKLGARLPRMAVVLLVLLVAAAGVPGFAVFAGEWLVFLGSFQTQTIMAAIALAGVVLVPVAVGRIALRLIAGSSDEEARHRRDLGLREYVLLIPALAILIGVGVAPRMWLGPALASAKTFCTLATRVRMIVPAGEREP